jgi:hypothetical protein
MFCLWFYNNNKGVSKGNIWSVHNIHTNTRLKFQWRNLVYGWFCIIICRFVESIVWPSLNNSKDNFRDNTMSSFPNLTTSFLNKYLIHFPYPPIGTWKKILISFSNLITFLKINNYQIFFVNNYLPLLFTHQRHNV